MKQKSQPHGISPAIYADEESVTLPNGLIIKMNVTACATGATITFGVAFPNGIKSVNATLEESSNTLSVNIDEISTASFKVYHGSGGTTPVHWIAIGY